MRPRPGGQGADRSIGTSKASAAIIPERRAGLAGDRPHRHAQEFDDLALLVRETVSTIRMRAICFAGCAKP